MAGKTIDVCDFMSIDSLATKISENYVSWENSRGNRVALWKEIQEYVFSTDTTTTTNAQLPWSNKTTIPKLCQIRDNLHTNYMATLFPKEKWLIWEGATEGDEQQDKVQAIESYMLSVVSRNQYYNTISQLVYDYIDFGNAFVMPEWEDNTRIVETPVGTPREQVGYVGPRARRISPLDIVFNPIATDFESTPKIIRSIISIGELAQLLESSSSDEGEKLAAQELMDYLMEYRGNITGADKNITTKDKLYEIAGFNSYQHYIQSGTVEVLTFYGDIYDEEAKMLHRNVIVKVVDRHKVIYNKPNHSYFGTAPIYHVGWRLRPDNLWAMGPLENLVGMQYRIDHLENMKSDIFDLIAYPVFKIKGVVEDFEWAPLSRIYVDSDGDVSLMTPDVNALNADTQIAMLENKMEEMSGSPREAMGIRSPGEKTKYEVQALENAGGRMFQHRITQFERHLVENLLNGLLELARRNITATTIRIFDDEFKMATFLDLTIYDITGNGRIRPMAARHFAEQANMLQNLTNLFNTSIGSDPEIKQHFSSIRIAQMLEKLIEIEDFNVVEPYIRLTEQADAQRLANSHQEQVAMSTMTPAGIQEGDFDPDALAQTESPQPTV